MTPGKSNNNSTEIPGRAHRVNLVQSVPTSRQIDRTRAVNAIIESLASETDGNFLDIDRSNELPVQQICPIRAMPTDFLHFQTSSRPNPIFQARASQILDAFEANISHFSSAIGSSEKLFRPQGTNPVTGQAIPPIFNNPGRLATGEDIGALTNNSLSNFSFQVVNNTYTINSLQPGQLNNLSSKRVSAKPSASPQEGTDKLIQGTKPNQKKTQTQKQLRFVPPIPHGTRHAVDSCRSVGTIRPEIPRSARKVGDILRWWVLPDPKVALGKALMEFTSEERNYKFQRCGKTVSNRTLYARRKTVSMAFFIFVKTIALKNTSWSLHHCEQVMSERTTFCHLPTTKRSALQTCSRRNRLGPIVPDVY